MKYLVGDLRIDTGRQAVSRSDVVIPLSKLSYDLFLVLIRAAPNVVSLDEMMHRVWPGLVVSPETVSKRVLLLRDALGEDAREPRYVAGLRGRGYQVIATVTEVAEITDASMEAFRALKGEAPPQAVGGDLRRFSPDEPRASSVDAVLPSASAAREIVLAARRSSRWPSPPILLLAIAAIAISAVGIWHLWSEARASVGNVDVTPNMFAGTWFGTLETCSPTTTYSGPFAVAISNTETGRLHLVYYGYGSDGAIDLTGSYDLKAMGNSAKSLSPAGITYTVKNQELIVSYPEVCQHGILSRKSLKLSP